MWSLLLRGQRQMSDGPANHVAVIVHPSMRTMALGFPLVLECTKGAHAVRRAMAIRLACLLQCPPLRGSSAVRRRHGPQVCVAVGVYYVLCAGGRSWRGTLSSSPVRGNPGSLGFFNVGR